MASVADTKAAEVQKLIKQYNLLKTEAQRASPAEATKKIAEAEKLALRIKALKAAIANGQAAPTTIIDTTGLNDDEAKLVAELESRIAHIEKAQQLSRDQLLQLDKAKGELARLQKNVEKVMADQKSPAADENHKLQIQLTELLEKTEKEQKILLKEIENIREQSKRDGDILKLQRDAARAQQQLEKEQWLATQAKLGPKWLWFGYGIAAGVGSTAIIIITLISIGVFSLGS